MHRDIIKTLIPKFMKKNTTAMTYLKLLSFVTALATSVYCAQALTVSPARLELSADPGAVVTDEFTVINEQDTEQTYYTSVENFEAKGESGTPSFSTNKDGLPSWVQVVDKITIKKGEKVKIPFTITIPADADAGGHFAAIFLSTIPPATKGGEVSVGAKVGMLMLLKVNGDIKEDGGVLSFLLKGKSHFATTLPISFVYRFNNNGNDRVKPVGNITIKNNFWLTTATVNANANEGNVLPNSTRSFEATWGEGEPLPASTSFFNYVNYEMKNFAFGFYFANLDLTFGTKTASNSLWMFIFPWHLMILVAIALAIVFMIFRSALKRYNKFIIAQARGAHAK